HTIKNDKLTAATPCHIVRSLVSRNLLLQPKFFCESCGLMIKPKCSTGSSTVMRFLRSECIRSFVTGDLKRKKQVRQKEEDFHHNVYVVLLRDTVAKHSSILRLNPKRDSLKPCVYVGMTGIPVDHRFENHKNSYKSAWVVRKYGVRLMPELYEHLNPMPFEAAVQMDLELA